MAFKKATRKQARLRLALAGPSGSGKTYSALRIAKGLGGKVAVIDTEHGSASLYSGTFDFDVDEMLDDYAPKNYIAAMKDAAESGYNVIIIDSITHAWNGPGGILDIVDNVAKGSRSGNSYMAWKTGTKLQNEFVQQILSSPCHIIATMRTKTAYEITEDSNGKKAPKKMGTKPEQREGLEYEFTTVLDLSVDGHLATSSKDRTGLFDDIPFLPSEETGEKLAEWLSTGVDVRKQSADLLAKSTEEIETAETSEEIAEIGKAASQTLTKADLGKLRKVAQKRQMELATKEDQE